jgi:hypothetical protein
MHGGNRKLVSLAHHLLIMVSKEELLLRVERFKARLGASEDQGERDIIARLIWALLESAEAVQPDGIAYRAERRYA